MFAFPGRSLCLTILAFATLACGDPQSPNGDSPALEAAVRDSADVRIIGNPRPPSRSRLGWHIGTEPTVSIGELEGSEPYLLDRVGDALVLPDGGIVVANGGSDELRVFDASGNHVVTWGGMDAYIERQVAATPAEERAGRRRELREYHLDRPMPETHPAYDAAMADLAGHLWVREYHLPGEGGPSPVWTVFDRDGRVLGFLETPAGLAIFEIGDDYILGLARDDLGVQSVQVWPLAR